MNCPSRKEQIEIPIQSTLPPPVPVSLQPQQQPTQKPEGAHIKRRKFRTMKTVIVLCAIGLGVWFVYNSSKPKLFAKLQLTPKVLRITNGNDTAWSSPTIILNDAFAGPILDVAGVWVPNETRELPLSDFRGRFNHQQFNPDYERVREVTIQAHGFQLGIYRTR